MSRLREAIMADLGTYDKAPWIVVRFGATLARDVSTALDEYAEQLKRDMANVAFEGIEPELLRRSLTERIEAVERLAEEVRNEEAEAL